jgi:mRNA interferase MazF
MTPLQWEVWQVALDPVVGHEQGGTRPGLVISNDSINETAQIITIVPLTRLKPGRHVYPTEVEIAAGAAGQPHASLAMTHQARALGIERFRKRYGVLLAADLRASVTQALRYTFRRAI